MYKCHICKKTFEQARQLNGHKKSHEISEKHAAYTMRPKHCQECNTVIPWKLIRSKPTAQFCSVSCRAKYFYKKAQLSLENKTHRDK